MSNMNYNNKLNIPVPEKDEKMVLCCRSKSHINRTKIKRLSLMITFSMATILWEEYRTYYVLPFVTFISFLSIFYNFPVLVIYTNTRPLYYDDLFIADRNVKFLKINPLFKKRFENLFQITLIITNAMFCAALSDYWLYELKTKDNLSYVQVLGVTGGILKIFQSINHLSGSILLYVIRKYVKKKSKVKRMIENQKNKIKNNISKLSISSSNQELSKHNNLNNSNSSNSSNNTIIGMNLDIEMGILDIDRDRDIDNDKESKSPISHSSSQSS